MICFLLIIGWKINLRSFISRYEITYDSGESEEEDAESVTKKTILYCDVIPAGNRELLIEESITHVHGRYVDYKSSHYFTIIGPPPDLSL